MINKFTLTQTSTTAARRAARETYWRDLWQVRGWRACLLLPWAWLFRLVVSVRRCLYQCGWFKSQAVGVPVVVVGGVMVGGVGKTPVVACLVESLQKSGFHPAIISRGYTTTEQKNDEPRPVNDESSSKDVGDEPILLHLKTQVPVWVGRRRVDTARALLRAHPECDVLVCDDGLQHYALVRDIEVVVMDERRFGNGWCLPAGPLREAPSRINSVDVVVWHKRCRSEQELLNSSQKMVHESSSAQHYDLLSYVSDAYNLFNPQERLPLSFFAHQNTLAWAGVAQPEVFFNMLAGHGINGMYWPLPDHFQFDADFVAQEASLAVDCVLMTEKDAVKYRPLVAHRGAESKRFWVVPLAVMASQDLSDLTQNLAARLVKIQTINKINGR